MSFTDIEDRDTPAPLQSGRGFFPHTIVGQFVFGTILVQLAVFAAFLVIGYREEYRETENRNHARIQLQANTVAGIVQAAMEREDNGDIAVAYRSLPLTLALLGGRLTDADGNTLRTSSNAISPELGEPERRILRELAAAPGYRLITTKANGEEIAGKSFAVDGRVRGIVWLYANPAVTLRSSRSLLKSIFQYGCCALVGNLFLTWLLSSTIARPLRLLRKAYFRLTNNPEDHTAFPLPVLAQNEVGELTHTLNTMVEKIEFHRQGTQDTMCLLDSMLSHAPVGFAFFDRECRYVRINENLALTHGVPVEQHLGKRLRDLMPPGASTAVADQKERWIRHVFNTGQPVKDCEIVGIMPGNTGDIRTWSDNFYPVQSATGEVLWVGVIVNEITHRLVAEEGMRRSEKLAAAGRLAASIAHEINNPLESVTNLLYLLREHGDLTPESQGYAEMAQQELARVAEITQQTLRFYRQSSAAAECSISDVLRSVSVLHQGRLSGAKVRVLRRIDEKAQVFAFVGELRQLFANLVGNAIDAMPKGGCLWMRVRRGTRLGVPGLWTTVADSGTGIPEKVRQRIFEPFFTTKETTGTGLGLWVSAEILAKHKGIMNVRSRVGTFPGDISGTVFRVFLPFDGVRKGPIIMTPRHLVQQFTGRPVPV